MYKFVCLLTETYKTGIYELQRVTYAEMAKINFSKRKTHIKRLVVAIYICNALVISFKRVGIVC